MFYLYKDEAVECLNVTMHEYELYFYNSRPKRRWVPRFENQTEIPLIPQIEEDINLMSADYDYSEFKTDPYEHQKNFLKFAKTHNKMLLLDEQGLGKTKQALDLIANRIRNKQIQRALIVCGVSSLQYNWLSEVKKHTNLRGYIIGTRAVGKSGLQTRIGSGKDKIDDIKRLSKIPAQVFIINIESLRNAELVAELRTAILDNVIQQLVVDEIHKCKNPKAKQTEGLLSLTPEYRLGLTGTPIVNSPLDLYPMMVWMGRKVPPISYFKEKYCIMGGWNNKEIVGYKKTEDLAHDMAAWTLRRTKEECLDLPEKTVQTVYVTLQASQIKLYEEIRKDLRERAAEIMASPSPMGEMIGLRKATSCPTEVLAEYPPEACAKLEVLLDLIEQILSNGKKLVIFTWFKFTLQYLNKILHNHGYNPALVYGDLDQETRNRNIQAFQTISECNIIIGTYTTMGTGFTLTAASTVVEYELPWTAADEQQAQDRCHRIGQYYPLTVVRLITQNTLDELNEGIVDGKAQLSGSMLSMSKEYQAKMVEFILNQKL